jgi:group II intron reverse transcriptase/maturase
MAFRKERLPTVAVKQKILKRQKLRNAEYYDFQKVQDKLYAKSRKNAVFQNLMQYVLMEENIKLAYRNIKKNDGSKTAGVDNKTIKNLANLSTEKLIKIVNDKLIWYKPQAIRRVEIPKDNDKTKTRPLGIPTIMERLIQQCFLQVLEPICEAKFHDRSNGFRPNRSQANAIRQCYDYMSVTEAHFVVDIDIKGFFDNVSHGKLLKQMWTMGIRDKKLLSIVSAMLKAEVAGIGFPEKGTAQGGVISPLLSNIVLNELDWWVTSQWEDIPTRHQYKGFIHENGTQSKANKYIVLRKSKLKECYIVRYADDFKIFCKRRSDANKMFDAVKLWLKDRLGLEINLEKSKVINLKRAYSEFLGLKLKVAKKGTKNKKNPKPKYIVRSHVRDKAISKIKTKLDRLIHDIEFPSGKHTEYQAISRYNSFVIGTHNYYNMATRISSDFKKLAFSVHKSLKARLQKRIKTKTVMDKKKIPYNLPQHIKERYGKSSQLKFVNREHPIVPIGFVQYHMPMQKRKSVNAYTPQGRAKIHNNLECVNMEILHNLMRNPNLKCTTEFNDNRLSLYCAQLGKCAITGVILEIGNMYCHHKLPRQLGGKDNYQNLMIVADDVHKLIHATKSVTIKKYMDKLQLALKEKKKIDELRTLALSENCLAICQV